MKYNNRDINLASLCATIIYSKQCDENFINDFLQIIKNNEIVNDNDVVWTLNCLNFLSTTNICDKVRFIEIESAKLQLLTDFTKRNNFYRYSASENPAINEIYFENEDGVIYKQYLPSINSNFALPAAGETGQLRIVHNNDNNELFEAMVLIDSEGFVQEIINEPKVKNAALDINDFSSIYTDLMSDILQYEDEE